MSDAGGVPPGYAPPGYAPPGYAPPGYAPPGYAPPGYAPPGTAPPGGPPGAVAPAPRPGCVPLRPLTLGDILDGAFVAIRRNPKVVLGLSAVLAVVQSVVNLAIQAVAYRQLGRVRVTDAAGATGTTSLGPLVGTQATQLVSLAVSTLIGAILTGLLTTAITQDALGVRLGARQIWEQSRNRLPALVGLALLLTTAQTIGLILCIAPGVWLWGIWAVAAPALMVERTGVGGAFRRSQQLVRRSFWRVWGIRALGYLVALIVGAFLTAPFLLAGLAVNNDVFNTNSGTDAVPFAFLVLTAVGSIVSSTFVAPLRAGVDALLYLDLRMRKEGLDIVLRQPGAATAGAR